MKVLQSSFTESELKYINTVLRDGDIGFGANVELFECMFRHYSRKEHNVAVNSASAAAFMIFAYLKEKYGTCDVYTTSLGFTSPAWAAQHFGHTIIWVDVTTDLLFDCSDYISKRSQSVSKNKIVLMPILYGGVSTIPNWQILGDEIVVVDSAHCCTPTIDSDFVFFSFHPTKPICTSDGGMLSTNIMDSIDFFRNYRNFGRKPIGSGYDIVQEGFKFYMNNLNATIGLVSIKNYYTNLETRRKNFMLLQDMYMGKLLNHDPNSSYYFATLLTDQADELNSKYGLAKHYPLLHKMTYYTNCTLHNTETLFSKIVNLPLYDINFHNS